MYFLFVYWLAFFEELHRNSYNCTCLLVCRMHSMLSYCFEHVSILKFVFLFEKKNLANGNKRKQKKNLFKESHLLIPKAKSRNNK